MKPWTGPWDLVRHALVTELHAYLSLARWLLRRPDVPAGTEAFGYARMVTPVLALWIFASAMEVPLFHVIVPWEPVRLAGLVLGVWGLVWMLGMLGGIRTRPHLVTDDALRVRNGPMHDLVVPWTAIADVRRDERDAASSLWALQSRELPDGGTGLDVVVGGRTNLTLLLTEPLELATRAGTVTVREIGLWADDPADLATRVRSAVSAA